MKFPWLKAKPAAPDNVGAATRAKLMLLWLWCKNQAWRPANWWRWLKTGWQILTWPWRRVRQAYHRRYRQSRSLLGRRSFWPPQIIFAPLLFIAFFLGMITGLDWYLPVAILTAAMGAVLVFVMVDTKKMLLVMFVLTFLVQGSALYFGNVRQAPWIAVGMAGLFFLRALLELSLHNRTGVGRERSGAGNGIVIAIGVYLACYFFSFLINRPPMGQMIASMKSIIPMFGVFLAFYWFEWGTKNLEKLWKLFLVIALIQFPVVVYQHFVVAARRTQGFDSVVGTFGGVQGAGGLSSVMVFFCVISIGYAASRWNRGLMSARNVLLFGLIIFGVILLGEVKASLLWLPIVTFIVLRRRALKNVLTLISYLSVASVLLLTIYTAYNAMYWSNLKGNEGTLTEKFDNAGGYFFDPRAVDYRTGEVSRGASLSIWANDRLASVPRRLIGYGPGSSKTGGSLGKGEVAKRFEPLSIDSTTAAVMLWDTGILGFASYSVAMLLGLFVAFRFVWQGRGSEQQKCIMDAALAALVIQVSMLIYNRTLTDEPTMQLLYLFLLGSVVQIARHPDPDSESPETEKKAVKGKRGAAALAGALPVPAPVPHAAPVLKPGKTILNPAPRRRPPVVYPQKVQRD